MNSTNSHNVVKLNRNQLRSIIEGVVGRSIKEASDHHDVALEVSSAVVTGLNLFLSDDTLVNNAYEVLAGTIDKDEMPVPARMEDVEHFAESAAQKVLADSELKNALVGVCRQVIESMMQQQGEDDGSWEYAAKINGISARNR